MMMFQVAAGVLIAGAIMGLVGFGLAIALDSDNRALGAAGPGWGLALTGAVLAIAVIYAAL